MNKIKRLDQQVIQKIAAGEIVERPAHIVKELLENAIDAGATKISLSIKNGGKDLIVVEDNGWGMSKDDALLSIEHHTTSKLEQVEDLETLSTYGFRGEALSSISSVSHLTLTTRDAAHSEGFCLHVSGSTLTSTEITAAPVGTTIRVSDLFFNVPARKKFLKKESTELNHIKQLFYATCFQAPSVYFTFSNDDRIIFSCPAVSCVTDRFIQLEGVSAQSHMLPLSTINHETITISGLISDTQYVSYDRSDIFVFVNNRWIKNTSLTRALINGYANSLPPQKYPRAILYITLNPDEVDINIHPKKEEVRFLHPRIIEKMVEDAVRKTLESKIAKIMRSTEHPQTHSITFPLIPPLSLNMKDHHFPHAQNVKSQALIKEKSQEITNAQATIPISQEPYRDEGSNQTQKQLTEQDTLIPIGQIFTTYILATLNNTLYIIDQHAAHERIMFERLITGHQGLLAIKLAFPILIPMPKNHQEVLLQFEHLFTSSGIFIESFDTTNLVVTATPARMTQHNLEDLCNEMLMLIEKEKTSTTLIEQKLLHHIRCHIACKAAVKAGDTLDTIAMLQLVSDLTKVPNRFCCPHGRPTMWEITITDLEKWFKRRV